MRLCMTTDGQVKEKVNILEYGTTGSVHLQQSERFSAHSGLPGMDGPAADRSERFKAIAGLHARHAAHRVYMLLHAACCS